MCQEISLYLLCFRLLYVTLSVCFVLMVILNAVLLPTCILEFPQHSSDIVIRFLNGQWQLAAGLHSTIAVQTAFADNRSALSLDVKLFGISSGNPRSNKDVFCQFWFHNGSAASSVSAISLKTGRGASVHGKRYQEMLYTCKIAKTSHIPAAVSIGYYACAPLTTLLPIEMAAARDKVDIGVCVPVVYGNISSTALIEWIELNRILGVAEFNFYVTSSNRNVTSVLRHYEKMGLVRLTMLTPPVPVKDGVAWCYWCQKLAVIPTLNHCLYSNMHRYKYLLSMDVDEVIIPQKQDTLMNLIKQVNPDGTRGGFLFQNGYFFLDLPATPFKDTTLSQLITIKYQHRVKQLSKIGYSAKTILKPLYCDVLQNHKCMYYSTLKSKVRRKKLHVSMNVPPSTAYLHHYKKCHLKKQECKATMSQTEKDNRTLAFSAELAKQFTNSLNQIILVN